MLALICVLGYLGATVFFYNTNTKSSRRMKRGMPSKFSRGSKVCAAHVFARTELLLFVRPGSLNSDNFEAFGSSKPEWRQGEARPLSFYLGR